MATELGSPLLRSSDDEEEPPEFRFLVEPRVSDDEDEHARDGFALSDTPKQNRRLAYCALYRFADCLDAFLIAVGTITAAAAGATFPMFSVIFGRLIDVGFRPGGSIQSEIDNLCIWFLVLGGWSFAMSSIASICWGVSSERQTRRLRKMYVECIFRQDMSFFDQNPPGTLTARLGSDTALIQAAIGEKWGTPFNWCRLL